MSASCHRSGPSLATLATLIFAFLQLLENCSGGGTPGAAGLKNEESGILAQISEEELRWSEGDLTAIGPRLCGTAGEAEARDYVSERFTKMGLEVSLRPFDVTLWRPISLEMELDGPEAGPAPGVLLGFSPSTPPSGTTAQTVYVGKGMRQDYQKLSWSQTVGRIHLADSSADTDRTFLYINAQLHGAVGFVHMKTWKGEAGESLVAVGSVQPLATIPAVAVDKDTGDRLRRNAGEQLTIRGVAQMERSTSSNVEAILPGRSDEFITVGAHFDSWDVGESAADNASGVAGLIEVARVLSEHYDLDRSIHFLAFSAEELDLQGSINYVFQNLPDIVRRCKFMVDLDICGLAGGRALITASPSTLGEQALEEAENMGFSQRTGSPIEIAEELELGSDHLPYLALGIPSLYISKTPFLYYHTLYDTLDRLDFRSMRVEVALAARIIAEAAGAVPRPPAEGGQ